MPKRPARVIVEFVAAPAAYAGKSTASTRTSTLNRFRRDVQTAALKTAIRHEYKTTFLGVAIEADAKAVEAIRSLPYVRAVHPDGEVHALALPAAPNDVVSNAGQRVNSLGLPTRGEGMRVAVIDTGIDYTHPALGGGFGPGYKVAGGYDFVNDDPDPFDDNGHGTHVAGIIAADSDTIIGVAPRATLYAFKVLDSGGSGNDSDVIAGIEAAADPNGDGDPSDHLDVANLSLGGPGGSDDPKARAVDAAVAAGVVVCVAAGNSAGFAIISSPGNSRSAVTVGAIDDKGAVTSFSSRGPSPGSLDFKPDVVAPGLNITSTFPGNGVATLSGTSMATPHVAGACALLRSLHPDWTPDLVKSALTSSATTIDATPADRGAGRVDAERASQTTLFAGGSGLSFGLDAAGSGTFDVTRSITVTNRGSAARSVAAAATDTTGVTLTIAPSSAAIGPGQSQSFDVHLSANNGKLGYPLAKSASGTLTFTSAGAALSVPWIVVRSARVTVSYHGLGAAFGYMPLSTGPTFLTRYSDDNAEAYVAPGKVWDFLVSGRGPDDAVFRLIMPTSRAINGDDTIAITAADAPNQIQFAAFDEHGLRLRSLPQVPSRRRRSVMLQLDWQGKANGLFTFIIDSEDDTLFVSALPQTRLDLYETYMDVDGARFFNVRHDELINVAASATLSKDVSSYLRSQWNWSPRGSETTLSACGWLLRRGSIDAGPFSSFCLSRELSGPITIDSYISPEGDSDKFVRALSLSSDTTGISYIRADAGGSFVSTDAKAGPQELRIENGGTATVGLGPVIPVSIIAGLSQTASGGFAGAFGDVHGLSGTSWATYAASGAQVSSGILPDSPMPAFLCVGCRIDASYGALSVAGHVSRGDVTVRMMNSKDFDPPSLTSLLLLSSDRKVVDRLKPGETATLTFSAADFVGTSTHAPNTQATKAAWRIHGAAEWHDLPVILDSSENGANSVFGRRLLGDIYHADISPATAVADVLIDLRLDVEDTSGNGLSWTQTPAFMVGNVPIPPRRRSAR
ncbi:MAG TPA: S8 family serine peptidase [Thermoanaerobaculia bacterium]|nr:S8 family serine peptidase [Thermoanaerobaculia bacterium]